MFRKLTAMALAAIFSCSVLLAGCGNSATPVSGTGTATPAPKTTSTANDKPVAGFIFVGPTGDGGWSGSHEDGRKQVEKDLGVKTIFKESVPEGPEVEKVMKDMIDQGVKIIFATSFGYMDYVEKVAKQNPNVKFMHCSGYKTSENMGNYFGRIEQARYLSGIVAGLKTKSNKIGYVAAFDIPEVVRGINSFTLGVRSVNPNAKVNVTWTSTWYDPAKEKDAAKTLLADGCDVIAQHQDTTGPQIAAEEKGAFAIGYNTDSRKAAPKAFLTAPVWNWGPYYVKQVKAVMDGTWKAESYWKGMEDGIVALAPLTDLATPEAKTKVEEVQKKLLAGSFNVFAGPIKDQSGKERVAAGQVLSDKDQLSCDWFVEGVVGKMLTSK